MLFYLAHAAMLAILWIVAAAAGTLVLGAREGIAMRSALGLALCAHLLFALGVVGQLRGAPIAICAGLLIAGGFARMRGAWSRPQLWILLAVLPPFVLALYPPVAFDETTYHLPTIRAFATAGAMPFLPDLRFPIFPQLHELLCVPPFLFAGDTATHLVAVLETLLTAGLLLEWGRRREAGAGMVAAALFVGSPTVLQLATITYVEAALALFVAAGFYALDRSRDDEGQRWLFLAGLFFGTACGMKYTGLFFAAAGLAAAFLWKEGARMRSDGIVLGGLVLAAIPTYARLISITGNPVFPFFISLFGRTDWSMAMPPQIGAVERLIIAVRLPWDALLARGRLNHQPPLSPLLILAIPLLVAAAIRNRQARFVLLMTAVYSIAFTFLPRDARYLAPLLPLICATVGLAFVRTPWRAHAATLSLAALLPTLTYAGWRFAGQGAPPMSPLTRREYLERRIPPLRALDHAGPGRVYVCHAEQLHYFHDGDVIGDFTGPDAFERVLEAPDLRKALEARNVRYYLTADRACPRPAGFQRIYEDDAATLWRVVPLP